jgi:bifunctional non-homologous end joining protein LigD
VDELEAFTSNAVGPAYRPTLHERRRLLHDLVGSANLPQFAFSRDVPGTGPEVFAAAEAMGLEGIVSKDLNSPYRSGTSLRWLKTRRSARASST